MKVLAIVGAIIGIALLVLVAIVQKKARAELGSDVMSRWRGGALFYTAGTAIAGIVMIPVAVIEMVNGGGVESLYIAGAGIAVAVVMVLLSWLLVKRFFKEYETSVAWKMSLLLFCVGVWAWIRISWIWVLIFFGLMTGQGLSLAFGKNDK